MPWWVFSLIGAGAVLTWRFTAERRAAQRNHHDRCAECGQRLDETRFRFEGKIVCTQCADAARQDVVWGAWIGFTLGALGILVAIGILLYYLIAARSIEVLWIALPAMFGLYFVWAVRSQARYLRGQNRLAEQIEAIEKLEAIPDAGAPQNSTLVDS